MRANKWVARAALAVGVAAAAPVGVGVAGEPHRSVVVTYERPSGVVIHEPTDGAIITNFVLEDQTVRAKKGEKSVSVEIADAAGVGPVADVHIDHDGDGEPEVHKWICGATEKPLKVRAGSEVIVRPYSGQCEDGSPSLVTEGEITLTFHKAQMQGHGPHH